MQSLNDTIAAIATPFQKGAIGIIRVSGKKSENVLLKIMPSLCKPLQHRKVYYGKIVDPFSGKILDEGICFLMRAPHSYTGEDVFEVQIHGGVYVLNRVLDIILKCGVRQAERGEFTKRALLNGKIDLLQAEAILDIVNAKSEKEIEIATKQLLGELSERIKNLKEGVIEILSKIEGSIDFADEDINFFTKEEILDGFEKIIFQFKSFIESFTPVQKIKEGIQVVICGKPNSGKSTLFNKIIKEERAIVDETPGTTRDFLDTEVIIDGVLVHLFDTAGIRITYDSIEAKGVEKTLKCIKNADILLVLFDGSSFFDENDKYLIENCLKEKSIYIMNKIDLPQNLDLKKIPFKEVLNTSLKTGAGFKKIIKTFTQRLKCFSEQTLISNFILTQKRHKRNFELSLKQLKKAKNFFLQNREPEIIALHLREAIDKINEILGINVVEDVLEKIFSEFCIGK